MKQTDEPPLHRARVQTQRRSPRRQIVHVLWNRKWGEGGEKKQQNSQMIKKKKTQTNLKKFEALKDNHSSRHLETASYFSQEQLKSSLKF